MDRAEAIQMAFLIGTDTTTSKRALRLYFIPQLQSIHELGFADEILHQTKVYNSLFEVKPDL